jgi:hypothetical protein
MILAGALLCSSATYPQELQGRFYPEKASYMLGEPVLFSVEIRNAGTQPVFLNAKNPGKCSDNYQFSVSGPGPSCGAKWDGGCGDKLLSLKPGESNGATWPLNFWYQFEREGKYEINATRHLPIMSTAGEFQDFTFSSKFEITMTPLDPARVQNILQDFERQLNSSDPDVRHSALDVLATTAPAYFQGIALTLSRSKDQFAVLHAVGALARINTAETRAALADLLTGSEVTTEDETLVRFHAIEGLGHDGDPSYQALIGLYLDDKNEHIQLAAMVAIAQLAKADTAHQLQRFFFSSNPVARKNVAAALRFSTNPESVEALIDLITDKDAGVRQQVLTSLAELTGHSVAEGAQLPAQAQNAWRGWWRENKAKLYLPERLEFVCHMK